MGKICITEIVGEEIDWIVFDSGFSEKLDLHILKYSLNGVILHMDMPGLFMLVGHSYYCVPLKT